MYLLFWRICHLPLIKKGVTNLIVTLEYFKKREPLREQLLRLHRLLNNS